ncbi:hypothetical protein [Sulfurimonas sp.]
MLKHIQEYFTNRSVLKDFINLNLFMGFVVVVTYLLEPLKEYENTKAIINIWMASIGVYLIVELIGSTIKHNVANPEGVSLSVSIDLELKKELMVFASEKEQCTDAVVESALREYLDREWKQIKEAADKEEE